jgi:hypothetical protein
MPTEPPRGQSREQRPVEPLEDLRDLLKEEVAKCNHPIKLSNLIPQENEHSINKGKMGKHNDSSDNDNFSSS